MTHYDGIIIGGGPGGYEAAFYATRLGKRVALVEKYRLGGVCLHWGCIPTKTLIASAKNCAATKNASIFGMSKMQVECQDWSELNDHQRKIVESLEIGLEKQIKNKRIDVYYGCGSLVDSHTVKVEPENLSPRVISADKIFIATGSKPLPVPGTKWEDNWLIPGENSLTWKELPKSMLVIGGGVMGVEFACMFNSFDVDVHIVEIMDQTVPGEDIDISRTLTRELKKDGIKLHLSKKIIGYKKNGENIDVEIDGGETIRVQKILVCAVRTGITENLGLKKVGVEINEHGYIKTDNHNRTIIDNIYAIGDVSGPPLLAHSASYEGKIAVRHAFTGCGENDLSAIPAGIYTIPEIGRVGLTEQKCKDMGIKYRSGHAQMRLVGRAHAECQTTGFAKIIVDEKDRIIGGHIMGKEAGEIIQVLALAMSTGMTARELEDKMIFAHPTLTEVIWEALKEINNPL